ncbi:MAG: hypothetical protein ACR2LU_12945 [Luteitalea sp.]
MPTALQAATALADDLERIFGARLRAVLVYGAHARPHARTVKAPIQTLALVDLLTYADLAGAAERAGHWLGRGLDMPLLLPEREFARALDAFPLEYGDIIAHHVVVRGADPLTGLSVAAEDTRRAVEVRARGHAIHLREGFMLAQQRPQAVANLIVGSASPFASLIESFVRVTGVPTRSAPQALAAHVGTVAALDSALVERLLTLEEEPVLEPDEATHLYPAYLDLMHALIAAIDAWTPSAASAPAAAQGPVHA